MVMPNFSFFVPSLDGILSSWQAIPYPLSHPTSTTADAQCRTSRHTLCPTRPPTFSPFQAGLPTPPQSPLLHSTPALPYLVTLRKVTFCPPKRHLSHSKTLPIAHDTPESQKSHCLYATFSAYKRPSAIQERLSQPN